MICSAKAQTEIKEEKTELESDSTIIRRPFTLLVTTVMVE